MRILFFCLLLLGFDIGTAQDFKKVSCRFLGLDPGTPVPPLLNLGEKEEEVPCMVHTEGPSPALFCHAKDNTITFVTADGRKPAAVVKLPAKGNAFILVFIPAPKAPDALPWRVFVIENSPGNFPDGGAFVANFHKEDIRFSVGESKLMLNSGGSHGFEGPKKIDNFNMAPVRFEFQQDKNWVVAKESMLRFIPGIRYLMFAYLDPKTNRARISTFRDGDVDSKPPEPPA